MVKFNWGKSIFPIFSAEVCKERDLKNGKFMGTCFFTVIEDFPILLTAKHLFNGFEKNKKELFLATRYGNNDCLKLHCALVEHKKLDIAFLILEENYYNKYKDEFDPIKIEVVDLEMGADVFTFGFPNSQFLDQGKFAPQEFLIDQLLFKGYIQNIQDKTNIGSTHKTYKLNFPSMPGNSGAPLMVMKNDGAICIGILLSNDVSYKFIEERVVDKATNKTGYIYEASYHGLACNAQPFYEIIKLIRDVNQNLKGDNMKPV